MGTMIPISIPPKRLSESITSSATSFKVNNIEGWDGEDLTSADLGTQHFCTFVNETRTLFEIVEIDPATIASASITILKRGLKFDGTETEVTANKLNWTANETIVLFGTDVPQLLNNFVDKAREQTITGYKSVPDPTASGHIASRGWVLNQIASPGTVSMDKVVVAGTAGETVAAGNLLYFDETDNEWKKCDADTAASVNNVKLGIAQGAGTDGNAISGGVLIYGLDTNQSGMTQGDLMYASNTAGAISSSTGTTELVIGIARTTTNLYFDPEFYYRVTAKQKAALAGSTGTPSSTNKYITQDNTSSKGIDQSQTTENATAEVGEADSTTRKNKLAQSFIPAKTKIRGVRLSKQADTGTFTGTVTIALQADSSGSPSGSNLASVTLTNADWLSIANDTVFEAIFSSEYGTLTVGSLYWIVISTSTSDTSNHPNVGTNSAGGYSSGSAKYNNTTDGWVAISTIDLYFVTLEGVNSQVVTSDSSGDVFGAKMPVVNVYTVTTVGSSTTQFDITNPSGTTFRYTYDGTGTDPVINATTFPVGRKVHISSNIMAAANTGTFTVTGSGANYFEVTNAAGVAESNKTLGLGLLAVGTNWTKPNNLKYAVVEVGGGGGGGGGNTNTSTGSQGGGGGGYSKKTISAASLPPVVPLLAAGGGFLGLGSTDSNGGNGGTSSFGSFLQATGGEGGHTASTGDLGLGGVGSGGDINIGGTDGAVGSPASAGASSGGSGGNSVLGGGGRASKISGAGTAAENGNAYGGGGGGASGDGNNINGGAGAGGVVIVTEYY